MKLSLFIVGLPTAVYGFSMGSYDKAARITTRQHINHGHTNSVGLEPRNTFSLHAHSTEDVDKAFEALQEEVKKSRSAGTGDDAEVDEAVSKFKKWVNRYFDLFAEMDRDTSGTAEKAGRNERDLRKTQDLTNRVIDFAVELGQDISTLDMEGAWRPSRQTNGGSNTRPRTVSVGKGEEMFSPLYSIQDDATVFKVQLELPGVNIGDVKIELDKDESVLVISGQRQLTESGKPMNFSKRFGLESTVDTEKISAKLDKGILTVAAPKQAKVDPTRRISIDPGN